MPDRQPVALPPANLVLKLTEEEIEAKIAAFKCHTSQAPLFPFFEETVRKRGKSEQFHLIAAATPRKMEIETDMFAGIVRIGNWLFGFWSKTRRSAYPAKKLVGSSWERELTTRA